MVGALMRSEAARWVHSLWGLPGVHTWSAAACVLPGDTLYELQSHLQMAATCTRHGGA